MLAFFLILLGVPLVVAAFAFVFLDGITWKEFGLIILAQAVIAGSSAGIVSCSNTADTEVWNGVVTGKQKVPVPCSHTYSCNCHEVCSGSGKNRSCHEECDTCYEHYTIMRTIPGNDYDWDVYTSNGETITIDRIDRQGAHEPPRYTAVRMGEPTSLTHSYVNYVKAAPDSLFRHQGLKEKYANLPAYPQHVYDYYRLDRLVTVGVNVPDASKWNRELMRVNADLGRPKQVNIIVVLVKNQPQDWYYALEEAWVGGKKNDAVLVVSVDEQMKPQWATVMAWTTNELFKVKLRDDIMAEQTLDRDAVMTALANNVRTTYQRKPMKDFEYLSSQITPTTSQWIITMVIGLLVAIGLIIFFQVIDVFDEERRSHSYRIPRNRRRGEIWADITKPFRRLFNTRPWENV